MFSLHPQSVYKVFVLTSSFNFKTSFSEKLYHPTTASNLISFVVFSCPILKQLKQLSCVYFKFRVFNAVFFNKSFQSVWFSIFRFYNPCKPLQLTQKNFLGTPLTLLNNAQPLTNPEPYIYQKWEGFTRIWEDAEGVWLWRIKWGLLGGSLALWRISWSSLEFENLNQLIAIKIKSFW